MAVMVAGGPTLAQHIRALVTKRAISATRDVRLLVFQLVIPVLVLFFGLVVLMLKPHPNNPSVTFTTTKYNPPLGLAPLPFNVTLGVARKVAAEVVEGPLQPATVEPKFRFPLKRSTEEEAVIVAGPRLGPALVSMSEFLIETRNTTTAESRYGAVVFEPQRKDGSLHYAVLHNTTSQHAAPTYINVVNAAILRLATGNANMTLQTRNHPLPMSFSQRQETKDINAFSAAIIITVAFSFIPASFAVSIVKEREVKAKHQQLVSGVSLLAYWLSTFLWDFISYMLPCSLSILLFFLFRMQEFVGVDVVTATGLLMVGFGPAVSSLTYIFTFFFSEHSTAQNVVLLIHFFTGLLLMITSFIMGMIPATTKVNKHLKNLYRLSPGFCLADGLASLALRHQKVRGVAERAFAWDCTGGSITYLYCEALVYFGLTLLVEYRPVIQHMLAKSWPDRAHREPAPAPDDEDADVAKERARVAGPEGSRCLIRLLGLRKVYSGGLARLPKVAVESLSFGVGRGECFGFLGVNGAGKTTTLSMLSGEFPPTAGTAYIVGHDISVNETSARRLVGYCPQFDALLDLLTPREHLTFYARIKGVPEAIISEVVEKKLREMELLPFATTLAVHLSGGNKRKLSVGIAMVGEPPIVILDEPSTGMDPVARRFMWDVITRLSTRRRRSAVLLTTHSMAEAQALCTRIGIMVGGRLRCIGSPQHLKGRYGNALELEVRAATPSRAEIQKLFDILRSTIPVLLRLRVLPPVARRGGPPATSAGEYDSSDASWQPPPQSAALSEGEESTSEWEGGPSATSAGEGEHCIDYTSSVASDGASESIGRHGDRNGGSWARFVTVIPSSAIVAAAHALGDGSRARMVMQKSSAVGKIADGVDAGEELLCEALRQQMRREGFILAHSFCEWWLACDRTAAIDTSIRSSFSGASLLERNGANFRYQLPLENGLSLAFVFGHMEENRRSAGIAEYSVGQTTLEAIFNGFAARNEEETH